MRLIPTIQNLAPLLLLVLPLHGADQTWRFLPEPGSTVTINGTSPLHDWRVEGEIIQGFVELGDASVTSPGQDSTPGGTEFHMEGFIPVRSLHSTTEGHAMDAFLHFHLKEKTNPRILFRFSNLRPSLQSKSTPGLYDSQVELVVAGVTNKLALPVLVQHLTSDKLKITASTNVAMTDFGIEPPTFANAKIGNDVRLAFEWLVARHTNN